MFTIPLTILSQHRQDINLRKLFYNEKISNLLQNSDLCKTENPKVAVSEEISNDGTGFRTPKSEEQLINSVIMDWLSIKRRAEPDLLKAMWQTFNVLPEVYDSSSCTAAESMESGQIGFDFLYSLPWSKEYSPMMKLPFCEED